MKNLRLLTEIKQDVAFLEGRKTLQDFLNDPDIGPRLSTEDILHLKEFEQSIQKNKKYFNEFEKAGIDIKKITDDGIPNFFRLPVDEYKRCIPIMVDWLKKHPDEKWSGVVRDLTTTYAKKQAYPFFIEQFKNEYNSDDWLDHKWVLGNALEVFMGDDILPEVLPLVTQKKYKKARRMLVMGLGKIKKPENRNRVIPVLLKLLSETDVVGHAIFALGKLRSQRAKPYLIPFAEYTGKDGVKRYWKREAINALKKIEKSKIK